MTCLPLPMSLWDRWRRWWHDHGLQPLLQGLTLRLAVVSVCLSDLVTHKPLVMLASDQDTTTVLGFDRQRFPVPPKAIVLAFIRRLLDRLQHRDSYLRH